MYELGGLGDMMISQSSNGLNEPALPKMTPQAPDRWRTEKVRTNVKISDTATVALKGGATPSSAASQPPSPFDLINASADPGIACIGQSASAQHVLEP